MDKNFKTIVLFHPDTPLIFKRKIEAAAAKDAIVCPDGKEKPDGGGIRREISLRLKGLGLLISSFKSSFPRRRATTGEKVIAAPSFLYLSE